MSIAKTQKLFDQKQSVRMCNFIVPHSLMEYFEMYHKYFLEYYETRTFDQTISILLKYTMGDTKKISPTEIVTIEEFFYHNEHIFSEFLHWFLSTLQIEKKPTFRS